MLIVDLFRWAFRIDSTEKKNSILFYSQSFISSKDEVGSELAGDIKTCGDDRVGASTWQE